MQIFYILFLSMFGLFALEEFILIKPVSTIAESDRLSKLIENLAIWVPAVGMGATAATMYAFGNLWLGGAGNVCGIILSLSGLIFRYWSRKTLGRFFTIGVVKQEGHQVIRSGPYRIVRHPAYLGMVLFYLGLPVIIGSWAGLLVLSLPAWLIFMWLITVEDNRLAAELGDEYREFQRESKRLIPGIW